MLYVSMMNFNDLRQSVRKKIFKCFTIYEQGGHLGNLNKVSSAVKHFIFACSLFRDFVI